VITSLTNITKPTITHFRPELPAPRLRGWVLHGQGQRARIRQAQGTTRAGRPRG
jgi:hypothetical protein